MRRQNAKSVNQVGRTLPEPVEGSKLDKCSRESRMLSSARRVGGGSDCLARQSGGLLGLLLRLERGEAPARGRLCRPDRPASRLLKVMEYE